MTDTVSRNARESSSWIEGVFVNTLSEPRCTFRANGVKVSGRSNGLTISPIQPVQDQDGNPGLRVHMLGKRNRQPSERKKYSSLRPTCSVAPGIRSQCMSHKSLVKGYCILNRPKESIQCV